MSRLAKANTETGNSQNTTCLKIRHPFDAALTPRARDNPAKIGAKIVAANDRAKSALQKILNPPSGPRLPVTSISHNTPNPTAAYAQHLDSKA